jgi:Family of unknown function (DUF5985)
MVPAFVYGLCMVTALMCAWMLMQAYQKTHYRLLFWCGLFFSIAALNNVFLVVDKLIDPSSILRRTDMRWPSSDCWCCCRG